MYEAEKRIGNVIDQGEKLLARMVELKQERDESDRKIRELGILPDDAFNRYVGLDSEQLLSQLHHCKDELDGFGIINKKVGRN